MFMFKRCLGWLLGVAAMSHYEAWAEELTVPQLKGFFVESKYSFYFAATSG